MTQPAYQQYVPRAGNLDPTGDGSAIPPGRLATDATTADAARDALLLGSASVVGAPAFASATGVQAPSGSGSPRTGQLPRGAASVTVYSSGVAGRSYAAFPGLESTGKSLLALFRVGTDHGNVPGSCDGRVWCIYSDDSGAHWDTGSLVWTPPAGQGATDVDVALLSDGRLVATIDTSVVSTSLPFGTVLYLMWGDANPATGRVAWQSPVTVQTSFTLWAQSQGKVLELPSGTLLWPIYGKNTGDAMMRTAVLRSTDHGATWAQVAVAGTGATNQYNESGGWVTPGGGVGGADRVNILIRHDQPGAAYAKYYSDDDGLTWQSAGDVVTVTVCGKPSPTRLASGAVALVARGPGVNTTEACCYWTSWDDGATWSGPTIINDTVTVYAGVRALGGGSVGIAYAQEGGPGAEIFFADLCDGAGLFPSGLVKGSDFRRLTAASTQTQVTHNQTLTAATTVWADLATDAPITLPSAGTYLIAWDTRIDAKCGAGGYINVYTRLFDSTANTAVPLSNRGNLYDESQVYRLEHKSYQVRYTVTQPTTLKLQWMRDFLNAPASNATLRSNDPTNSVVVWQRTLDP